MPAKSSKGVQIRMVRGAAAGDSLTPTAVTLAAPAVVSVADVTGIATGDLVELQADSTGISEIDGRTWVIGAVDTTNNNFELVGSDASGSADTFAAGTPMLHYPQSDSVVLCFNNLTFNPNTPETISVATYCDPTAQIPSAVVGAGTIDFGGYVDINDADYQELLQAERDGEIRDVYIMLPNNGYLYFPVTVGQVVMNIPLEGAVEYSGNATLNSKPRHLF